MPRSGSISAALLAVAMLIAIADGAAGGPGPSPREALLTYGQLPLTFFANYGQADPRVAFIAQGLGHTVFLSATEAVVMTQTPQSPGPSLASRLRSHPESFPGGEGPSQKPRPAVIRMRLVGANPSSVMTGEEQTGHVNYLIGNDRSKWLTNVPAYARVRSQGVYPGIDLVFYASGRQFEYDFVVKPGADPRSIRLVFDGGVKREGRSALRIDAHGDLVLRTDYGDLRLRRPLAYQEIDGERRPVRPRATF